MKKKNPGWFQVYNNTTCTKSSGRARHAATFLGFRASVPQFRHSDIAPRHLYALFRPGTMAQKMRKVTSCTEKDAKSDKLYWKKTKSFMHNSTKDEKSDKLYRKRCEKWQAALKKIRKVTSCIEKRQKVFLSSVRKKLSKSGFPKSEERHMLFTVYSTWKQRALLICI